MKRLGLELVTRFRLVLLQSRHRPEQPIPAASRRETMTQTPEVSKSHQTGAPSASAGLLSSSKLTFRQQEVFDLLVAYINQHGYPPTLSELADMLGVSSSNAVLLHLRALERKNFIKLSRRVSRGISIVGRKEPMLAVQLLQEMIAEEPGARERAIEFLRLFGDQP